MKLSAIFLAVCVCVALSACAAVQTPISHGVLTSPLNANGNAISNVSGIYGVNGQPLGGSGSGGTDSNTVATITMQLLAAWGPAGVTNIVLTNAALPSVVGKTIYWPTNAVGTVSAASVVGRLSVSNLPPEVALLPVDQVLTNIVAGNGIDVTSNNTVSVSANVVTNTSLIVVLGSEAHTPNGSFWFSQFLGQFYGDVSHTYNYSATNLTDQLALSQLPSSVVIDGSSFRTAGIKTLAGSNVVTSAGNFLWNNGSTSQSFGGTRYWRNGQVFSDAYGNIFLENGAQLADTNGFLYAGAFVKATTAIVSNILDLTKGNNNQTITSNITWTFVGGNVAGRLSGAFVVADATNRVITLPSGVYELGTTTPVTSVTVPALSKLFLAIFDDGTNYWLSGKLPDTSGSGAYVRASAASLTNATANTPTANDNSTKIATTAYVDAAIAAALGGLAYVATPTFSPMAGTYTNTQNVAISSATAGTAIYFTTNGTTPTTNSYLYSATITAATNLTIQAVAVKSNMLNSAVATAAYVISASGGGGGSGTNTLLYDGFTSGTGGWVIDGTDTKFYGGQQNFSATNNITVTDVGFRISADGNIANRLLHARIWTPSGNNLGSQIAASDAIPGTNSWVTAQIKFHFSTPVALTASTSYHFTVDAGTNDTLGDIDVKQKSTDTIPGQLTSFTSAGVNNYPTTFSGYDLEIQVWGTAP